MYGNEVADAVVAAGQNHVLDLSAQAARDGWDTYGHDLTYPDARFMTGVFDRACIERDDAAHAQHRRAPITVDPEVTRMLGFGDLQPRDVRAGVYYDKNGQRQQVIRLAWETNGEGGVPLHTVAYLNTLPGQHKPPARMPMNPSPKIGFGYMRLVYSKDSGELIQVGQFRAERDDSPTHHDRKHR